ncbi:MAG: lamin tail domain-containing protein, partial [Christensenellales bacterium]
MRVFKNIIALIIAAAVCVGVLIYALGENGDGGGTSVNSKGSVRINEFMASNGGFLPNDMGEYSDWIELHNPTDRPVSLSGLGMSNDKSSVKWFLPDVSLNAGGYIVLYASGEGKTGGTLHTSFKLTASAGGIYLFDVSGGLIDSVEYKDQSKDISMGRSVEDPKEWLLFDKPTPGFSNDEAGFAAFEQSRYAKETSLIITEVMASNKITIADNKGGYSDYIEIFNSGDKTVNLAGFGLTDNPSKLLAWRFPDVDIRAGEHLLVFASGGGAVDTDLEAGYIHTDFRVAAYEETIVLSNPLGLILDTVTVSESQSDISYSRVYLGEGGYSDEWEKTSRA